MVAEQGAGVLEPEITESPLPDKLGVLVLESQEVEGTRFQQR